MQYVLKVLDRMCNVQMCSNVNIAHVTNTRTDLHSFDHICVHLHVYMCDCERLRFCDSAFAEACV